LPGGEDAPLTSRAWQPVPGAPEMAVFPFIRKIDVVSSNSYVIHLPDAIIVIDPGGLTEHTGVLADVVADIPDGHGLPVITILTHAHVDHFLGMQHVPLFADPARSVIVVQDAGATALEEKDTRLSQAAVLGREMAFLKAGLRLFCRQESVCNNTVIRIPLPGGETAGVIYDTWVPGEGAPIERGCICFGSGSRIEVYHTPGHSPDSICIRAGQLLFIGDLLFAANPGIAGLAGWEQEALLRSLDGVIALLDKDDIDLVCPGHGRVIPAKTARSLLFTARTEALSLVGIEELDSKRAAQTAAFAEECMVQVNELFTIMAGRLWYVSYVLEGLGESAVAEQANSLIRGDVIDGLLDAFRAFSIEHHAGNQVSIHLALKAGQVIAKLERAFERDQLARIIDPSIVNRADHLLSAYTSMLRGFPPPVDRRICDLHEMLTAVIIGCSVPPYSDDEVLSASDDDEAFLQMLLGRIGMRPLLDDVSFAFRHGAERPSVVIDREHFADLVTYILEDLVGTGAGKLTVDLKCTTEMVVIRITGSGMTARSSQEWQLRGFLRWLAEQVGSSLSCDDTQEFRRFTISIARAG